ncbi:MAG: hypothetical protein PHV80_03555 [Rugosibacter sp.]|jgi:cystathionine gamma-synthase|nr:hypothetical protein [Rugosibacter sp.]
MALKNNGFATNCIHAGEIADQFGAPHTPTYDTTTFKFSSTADLLDVIEGRRPGCIYIETEGACIPDELRQSHRRSIL